MDASSVGARLWFAGALFFAGALSACSTANGYEVAGAANCYRPVLTVNAANAAEIASLCTQAARETWPSVAAITNATFHAGVAERVLGERYQQETNAAEASRHFEAAVELLQRAISLAPTATSGRPRPPTKADGMLELARVRYGQARYQAAVDQADELLRLEDDPESSIHASAHYLRGLSLDADDKPLAALTDWAVFLDDALDDHPDANAARTRLIAVATRLGREALGRNSRADAQAAIDLFVRAQSAAEAGSWRFAWPINYSADQTVDQAGLFINLGQARLALAGLTSADGFADFACAPDIVSAELANQARADFLSATGKDERNDRAWRSLSCAELALGHTDQAIRAAERAISFAPAAGVERAEDYRMLGRARALLEPPTGAAAAFEEARLNAPDGAWRSRVLTELAAVYEDEHNHPLARDRLLEAVSGQSGDQNYAPAVFMLGVNYFAPDAPVHEYADAETYLLRADQLTDPRYAMHDVVVHDRDRLVRAGTLYYLSRLRIEWPGHYDGQAAVRYADEAFRLESSTTYRAQACLARVRAGNVSASSPTQGYCTAVGQASPTADTYLYEGVWHLRRAQYVRGGDRNRALEAAYQAFTTGLRVLPNGGDRLLHAELLQGQATAQYCIGFAQVGHDLQASIASTIGGEDALAVQEAAHKFYDDYRVMTCDGSVHQH